MSVVAQGDDPAGLYTYQLPFQLNVASSYMPSSFDVKRHWGSTHSGGLLTPVAKNGQENVTTGLAVP